MKRYAFLIISAVFILAAVIYLTVDTSDFYPKPPEKITYQVLQKWELPLELNEVSGITWLGDNKIACVQDEQGIIYFFDLETGQVEREIEFEGNGDFEGLAFQKDTAYVIRSDGGLYKISDYKKPNREDRKVKRFEILATGNEDFEGLCLDSKNNRLLLVNKASEGKNDFSKGIYSYNLGSVLVEDQPIISINLEDSIFNNLSVKNISKRLRPSEIAIHPRSGDYYILDASHPKIIILSEKGEPKKIHQLDQREFNQPEGICFSPAGELFISNEGHAESANILKVKLDN